MTQQVVSQFDVFVQMVKAMDEENVSLLRRADKFVRRNLSDRKTKQEQSSGVFFLTKKEASLFGEVVHVQLAKR